MVVRTSLLVLLIAAGALALDTSSLHRPDSSSYDAAARERLHKSLALPTSYNKQLDEAARERLHQSMALPTSYQNLKSSEPAGTPQQETSQQQHEASDALPVSAAGAQQHPGHEATQQAEQEEEAADLMPLAHSGIPCPHHKDMWHPSFSFGDMFAPLISAAARDVFNAEHIITSQMQDIFEDIFSGPAIPHVLDIIEGAAGSAAARMPAFPLAPFPIRGPRLQLPIDTTPLNPQPLFGVVITSSSPEISKNDVMSAQGPTWQQQVVLSSSDPSRLQQLADMFEQQLQGSGGFSRKLKSGGPGRVQPADVAQVVLVAARKLRATQAALAEK